MSSITIPASLKSVFEGSALVRVCDQDGKILGYYTPIPEATDEDYDWLFRQVTTEELEASLNSGPCRPASEVIAELRRKYGA
jgi:hypothetical protein